MSDRRVFTDKGGGFEISIREGDDFIAEIGADDIPNYGFDNPQQLRNWFKDMKDTFDRAEAYMKSRPDG